MDQLISHVQYRKGHIYPACSHTSLRQPLSKAHTLTRPESSFEDEGQNLRSKTKMEQMRQSRPDSGLGFQAKVLNTLLVAPSSLESGRDRLSYYAGADKCALFRFKTRTEAVIMYSLAGIVLFVMLAAFASIHNQVAHSIIFHHRY